MTDQTFIRDWLKARQESGMNTREITTVLARVVMELVEERAQPKFLPQDFTDWCTVCQRNQPECDGDGCPKRLSRLIREEIEGLKASGILVPPEAVATAEDGRKGAAGEPAPEVAPHQDDFETVREHIKGWTPRRGNHDKVLALLDRLQDRMRRMEGALEHIGTTHTWNSSVAQCLWHAQQVARAALGETQP